MRNINYIKNMPNRKLFFVMIVIISLILLVFDSLFLLNCMIEYKYNIDENFDQGNLYYTYSSRKDELDTVMWYLKGGILYLAFMILYFGYHLKKQR